MESYDKEQQNKVFADWYRDNVHIPQRETQITVFDRPNPMAVDPWYCRGYCEGFTIAKEMFEKKEK